MVPGCKQRNDQKSQARNQQHTSDEIHDERRETDPANPGAVKPDTTSREPAKQLPDNDNVVDHGAFCARLIGEIPAFDCRDGEEIVLTRDGRKISDQEWTRNMKCDSPAYLGLSDDGQCIPGSRLGRLKTTNPDADVVFICRRYLLFAPGEGSAEMIRPSNLPEHEDVAIIAHDRKSGATCWFQALRQDQKPVPLSTWRVPPPHEKKLPDDVVLRNAGLPEKEKALDATNFWLKPSELRDFQCTSCHDSGPWILTPHLAGVRHILPKSHAAQWFMPSRLQNPPHWRQPLAIKPKDPSKQNCSSCHAVGDEETCATFAPDSVGQIVHMAKWRSAWGASFPRVPWMPLSEGLANWHGARSVQEWSAKWNESTQATLECCRLHTSGLAAEFSSRCEVDPLTKLPSSWSLASRDKLSTITIEGTVEIQDGRTTTAELTVKDAAQDMRHDLRQIHDAQIEITRLGDSAPESIQVSLSRVIFSTFADQSRPDKQTVLPEQLLWSGPAVDDSQRTNEAWTKAQKSLIGAPLGGSWTVRASSQRGPSSVRIRLTLQIQEEP